MNKWMIATAIGAALTLGMAVTPVTAQHGHDHGHEEHDHGHKGHDHGHKGHDHGHKGHDDGHEGHSHAKKMGSTKVKALCPVMGEPIDFSVSVATDDGPVFMCCPGCNKKYEANPSKYATKVAAQRKALSGLAKVQVKCPVSGEPTDPDVVVEVGGKKVSLCCMGCAGKYKKNPGSFKIGLANSYTYQTKCPVMGTDIDPAVSTKLANGQSIYLCCKKCEKKLFQNPDKYAKALASQGYEFEASDLKPGK